MHQRMQELVCGAVAGCLLVTSPPLTFNGNELSPVVEVWAIQEPAVPATTVEEEPNERDRSLLIHPVIVGAIAGAGGGCLYGAAVAVSSTDISPGGSCVLNAIAFGGIVAGTVAFARWYRDAAP